MRPCNEWRTSFAYAGGFQPYTQPVSRTARIMAQVFDLAFEDDFNSGVGLTARDAGNVDESRASNRCRRDQYEWHRQQATIRTVFSKDKCNYVSAEDLLLASRVTQSLRRATVAPSAAAATKLPPPVAPYNPIAHDPLALTVGFER